MGSDQQTGQGQVKKCPRCGTDANECPATLIDNMERYTNPTLHEYCAADIACSLRALVVILSPAFTASRIEFPPFTMQQGGKSDDD